MTNLSETAVNVGFYRCFKNQWRRCILLYSYTNKHPTDM